MFGGGPVIIEYSPSNPVAGQPVTFTLINYEGGCTIKSLVPDVTNNSAYLIEFTNSDPNSVMHTYPTAGTYCVGFDLNYNECLRGDINNTNRALSQFFQMGPVGGPYTDAPDTNEPCIELIVAAPAPVPTMSQWGILILTILSCILGLVYLRNTSILKADL